MTIEQLFGRKVVAFIFLIAGLGTLFTGVRDWPHPFAAGILSASPRCLHKRGDFEDAVALVPAVDGDEPEAGEAPDRASDCPGAEQGRFSDGLVGQTQAVPGPAQRDDEERFEDAQGRAPDRALALDPWPRRLPNTGPSVSPGSRGRPRPDDPSRCSPCPLAPHQSLTSSLASSTAYARPDLRIAVALLWTKHFG
jgi:hypothetical protein